MHRGCVHVKRPELEAKGKRDTETSQLKDPGGGESFARGRRVTIGKDDAGRGRRGVAGPGEAAQGSRAERGSGSGSERSSAPRRPQGPRSPPPPPRHGGGAEA